MPTAIERIVDAYVRLGNRQALQDMLDHREKLVAQMRHRTDYDFSVPLGQINADSDAILSGIERLATPEI